ncbi:ribose transport system permease protein [Palleronia aestuarii]|uniref:Autoinducer 2 import system permease protein LsrD n=1 Tax=Palleronia aestuarii TaxID=568105 RepID=A0A2W7PRZ4_9RHOB|nr:ABC transporter permease [Palleronia aestuarii]PZX12189.1 ribose transport system permease protein [Palleronia aestuarii]
MGSTNQTVTSTDHHAGGTAASGRGDAGRSFGGNVLPLSAIVALVAIVLFATQPNFGTASNINSILFQTSIEFLAILGFTYVMVMREIDLSVGSVFALTGTLMGALLVDDWNFWLAGGIALAVAAGIGFCQGFLVVRFGINSLMLTIGSLLLIRGCSNVIANDLGGRTYPREFRSLARTDLFDIRITIVFMAVCVLIAWGFQKRSALFRKMCFIGENMRSAQVHGIRVGRIKIAAFMASAVTAGLGGIFTASRITHADVRMGLGLEFVMVTAAIIGGASLYGGRGDLRGSALGLLLLALVLNGMIMFDIEPVFQQFVIGALLIATVTFDTLVNRRNG